MNADLVYVMMASPVQIALAILKEKTLMTILSIALTQTPMLYAATVVNVNVDNAFASECTCTYAG